MMITTEVDFSATTKPEGNTTSNNHVNPKLASPSTTQASSSSWTRLKDPRIVRVSRAFGGKDRHSKVCTVRGLRDRRVRLSVPTAIQLYDLQDRLGLNQPSKVVDWLLDVAKNEIDELPPLQLPPSGNFNPNLQQWLCSAAANQAHIKDGVPLEPSSLRGKSKEQPEQQCDDDDDDSQDQNWNRKSEEEKHQQEMLDWISPIKKQEVPQQSHDIHQHHPNNLFQRSHNNDSSPTLPNLLSNNAAQFNSFLRWDPSSLSLSHHQPDHHVFQNFNVLPLTSPSGLPHSFFHPQSIGGGGAEFEPSSRQINFHMLSSGSQHPSPPPVHDFTSHSLRPLHFLASHNHSGSEPNKENEFHSR